VRAETRHQMKTDRFRGATLDVAERTVHWSVEHKNKLTAAVAALVVVLLAVAGGWYYLDQQDQKASVDLSRAVRTFDTPVRPANMPPQADAPSFASVKERAQAAQKQFEAVISQYPRAHAADIARYFVGLTSVDVGDNQAAERSFKAVASSRNKDFAALAKLALGSVYRQTGRDKEAIDLYKQLIDKPTLSVGKTTAQMELAATYEAENQPLEARRIYQQIQKENPSSQAGEMASAKLQGQK